MTTVTPAPGSVNEAVAWRPAEPLRPFVAYYSGYRQAGIGPAEHRGLPSPYLTLIFTLDEPLTVAEHPDPAQPAAQYITLAGGLHSTPALVTHEGSQSGIQLALSPIGTRAILGVPAGELAIIDVDGTDVLGGLASEISERIQVAASWDDRFAIIDRLLGERLRTADGATAPEVSYAWQRLLAANGAAAVSDLAAETGWSDRHLRSAFKNEIGLTPKAAARVIRFHRARLAVQRRAMAGRSLDLADLAAECGYYDQAHLDLDFKAMAGYAPTVWARREFRNFQAASVVGAEA
ncbi:MAG TPA: helix-turn-helix domain-containing protein [Streptosporangiaceae bacterium]|nr:helix-turn-helix domain-containing protein [Streptosporangiaceae bacterium]